MIRSVRVLSGFLVFSFLFAVAATAAVRELPGIDAFASAPPRPAPPLAASVGALDKPATSVRYEERLGVPTFIWLRADRAIPLPSAAGAGRGAEGAGRSALAAFASLYGLDPADVASAEVVDVHDTGRGSIITRFRQRIGGVEVFREELKVLMDRSLRPAALAGYVSGAGELARGGEGRFTLDAAGAVAAAVGDYTGATVSGSDVAAAGPSKGGFDYFDLGGPAQLAGNVVAIEPIRAKPVYFHLHSGLVAAYYVELNLGAPGSPDSDYYAYVVAAADGRVLFRNNLTVDANNPYSYRVWADPAGLLAPFDGPQGNDPTPLPSATNDGSTFPYVLQSDVTLSSLAGVTDAWLPAGATETNGNNVDAYANVGAPDGFTPGTDFRADVTAPGEFLRTHDPSLRPDVNVGQQKAAVTQLFYDLNFLHDWFYVSGFDEQSGNAQASNYGRGGVEGDSIKAQAQDFSGVNNANMSTPADGARPRMRMYLFTDITDRAVSVATQPGTPPILPTANPNVGTAVFGPLTFDTGVVPFVRAIPADGCTTLDPAAAGKIVLIDRGGIACARGFAQKAENAQAAGAVGVIIANVATSTNPALPPGMGGAPLFPITIAILSLNFDDGEDFRAHFTAGDPLTGRLTLLSPSLDGTIDNQIVAHEWGHYLSNRIIGNASGLGNNVGRGMGEGWSDFIAMLMSVKEEDSLVATNLNFDGVYAMAGYTTPAFSFPSNPYYFGIRRYPYSTTMSKDPLTFQHISDANALPLPGVAPVNPGGLNSEVHNTGEVWATMLWECYASLLRDTLGGSPRLTFAQARDRMKDYLVAAFKATPLNPTMLEARDALLAAAYLNDPVDFVNFTVAFAKRGAGVFALSADRFSATNTPVVESFASGAALAVTSMSSTDDVTPVCNRDGVLDNGETGTLTFTLRNVGNAALGATGVSVSSTTAGISFPGGAIMTVPATSPFGSTTATIQVAAAGLVGITQVDVTVAIPDLGTGSTVTQTFSFLANYDDLANQSATDDVESPVTQWTNAYGPGDTSTSWQRVAASINDHHYNGPDPGAPADVSFVSPLLSVGSGPFSIAFRHRFAFEFSGTTLFDGGVIELTADGGATWTDVGLLLTGASAYTGSLAPGGDNPLEGRLAFGRNSAGYPAYNAVTLNLGTTYAGKAVRLRFRVGSDTNTGAAGWDIDDIAFTGLLNTPFHALVPQPASCNNAPIAAAGTGFTVSEFGPAPTFAPVTVTLDGSASLDPDGNPITFLWTQAAGPAASLSSNTAMQPTFTAPQVPRTPSSTVLTFQLVVNDGTASSAPSLVNITVLNVNRPPTANAGPPQTVDELTTVTLNGSGSADPDTGDVITYAWLQTAGPAVTLSSSTAVSPTFLAPAVAADTTLTFRLIVNDGLAASAPSTVNVLVQNVVGGATQFYTVAPCRLVDTRSPDGPLGGPSLAAMGSRVFNLAGACAIPAGAVAVSVNVTVVAAGAPGFIRILASDSGPSSASTLNFGAGQTRANNAVLALSNDVLGGVTITNNSSGTLNVVVDVNGYFQ